MDGAVGEYNNPDFLLCSRVVQEKQGDSDSFIKDCVGVVSIGTGEDDSAPREDSTRPQVPARISEFRWPHQIIYDGYALYKHLESM